MVNWSKIRADYISGKYSYDRLAEMHKVSRTAIVNHSRKEGWSKAKKEIVESHIANVTEAIKKSDMEYTEKVYEVADKLLNMAEKMADRMAEDENLSPRDAKTLTEIVKNVKDIKGIKSEIDTKEQEARIKKLEKEIATDVEAPQINITIAGAEDGWSK